MLADSGAKPYACKASVEMFDLTKGDFTEEIEGLMPSRWTVSPRYRRRIARVTRRGWYGTRSARPSLRERRVRCPARSYLGARDYELGHPTHLVVVPSP